MPSVHEVLGMTTTRIVAAIEHPGCEDHRVLGQNLLRLPADVLRDTGHVDPHPFPATVFGLARLFEQGYRAGASPEVIQQAMFELVPLLAATLRWAHDGFPVLDLTLDYFHSIAATDFGDMQEEKLTLPFHEFVLRFPENTVLKGARSAFVYRNTTMSSDMTREEAQHVASMDPERNVRIEMDVGDRCRATLASTSDGQRWFTDWDAGTTLAQFFTPKARRASFFAKDETTPIRPPPDSAALANLRRIIGNTSLYVGTSGGLPPRGKKLLGPDVPVEREHADLPRFRVGRPIKLGPQLRQMAEQRTGTPWTLAARFVVRGHWRNQAHGPGHTLRKKLWVQPYWKGPKTLTEALERTYQVE